MPKLEIVETGLLYIGMPLAMVLNSLFDTVESRRRDLLERIGRETCGKRFILSEGVGDGDKI